VKATVVLPVKRFAEAKRRLSAGLDDERREALVAAMLEDSLEAIIAARSVERTIVVTGDPRAQEIVAASAAEVLPDPADEGHVTAALAGLARAEADGADCAILLPGDCPLLEPRELDRLLTGVPARYVAIVPDRHGTGTNALVLAPPRRDPAGVRRGQSRPSRRRRPRGECSLCGGGGALPGARPRHPGRPDRPDSRPGDRRRARPAHRKGARHMSEASGELRVLPVAGLPELVEGMSIGAEIAARAKPLDGDVVVVSQKVVSKAEGRVRRLSSAIPGAEARRLAAALGREPALVEMVLAESREVLRAERGVLIVETRHGLVCANAGIDSSNLPEEGTVTLLPEDPDASARRIRAELEGEAGAGVGGRTDGVSTDPYPRLPVIAVVISDSFGRAWRLGQVEVAIGCAGLTPLDDWRGRTDTSGRELEATLIAVADQAAAAADLVRDKASRTPAAIVRGLDRYVSAEDGPGAAALRRPKDEDLFR